MGDVIDFKSRKKAIEAKPKENVEYRRMIERMDRLELLEEMVRFQDRRSQAGKLTPQMMADGIILFKALEDSAITNELRLLTRSYRRHLEYELAGVGA